MSANKRAKEKLIELYGEECFIDKLHLRPYDTKHYTSQKKLSKKAKKIQETLTYHHIHEAHNNGKATIENGAVLSRENHDWFNEQPQKIKDTLNAIFQEYKKIVFEDENVTNVKNYLKLRKAFNTALSKSIQKRENIENRRSREKDELRKLSEDFLR